MSGEKNFGIPNEKSGIPNFGIPKQIVEFLQSEHVLSLCVCDENRPYACSCFYAFCASLGAVIIACEKSTKHMKIVLKNKEVAINIAHQTKILGLIKGAQATGELIKPSASELKEAQNAYFGAFSFARILAPELFVIKLKWIKLTNNALAKKIIWEENF